MWPNPEQVSGSARFEALSVSLPSGLQWRQACLGRIERELSCFFRWKLGPITVLTAINLADQDMKVVNPGMLQSDAIHARHYLTCLWPGLPELWWRGKLSALPVAIVFAVLLNLLLVVRFLYPAWLAGILVGLGSWIGVGVWAFLVIRGVKRLPELLTPRTVADQPDRFEDAQLCYLQAEWKLAERELLGVLAIEPRDPPALLLLSGVYRHTDRVESAKLLMTELTRLDVGESWMVEIQAERARIENAIGRSTEESHREEDDFEDEFPADLTAA